MIISHFLTTLQNVRTAPDHPNSHGQFLDHWMAYVFFPLVLKLLISCSFLTKRLFKKEIEQRVRFKVLLLPPQMRLKKKVEHDISPIGLCVCGSIILRQNVKLLWFYTVLVYTECQNSAKASPGVSSR